MLDKPLVTRREDLEKAKEILNNSGIQLGMLLTERYNPGLLALKQAVDQGLLGKITGFTIVKPHKLAPSTREPWLFSREENGGIVIDLLVHDFDLLRWIGGSEVADVSGWVQAGNWKDYPDFADDAKLLVRMEDGSTAALQTDWWTPDSHPNYGKGILICTGTLGKCVVYTTGDPVLHPGHVFPFLLQKAVNNLTKLGNMRIDGSQAVIQITGYPNIIHADNRNVFRDMEPGSAQLTHGSKGNVIVCADERCEGNVVLQQLPNPGNPCFLESFCADNQLFGKERNSGVFHAPDEDAHLFLRQCFTEKGNAAVPFFF